MDHHRPRPLRLLIRAAARGVAVAALAALCACGARPGDPAALAGRGDLVPAVVAAGLFDLYTLQPRAFVAGAPLSVYIEGDGYAFISRTRLSDDPTPRRPIALELAARDPSANVLYIARPCQYVGGVQGRNCHPAYWSVARYNEAVIAATNAVIDQAVTAGGAAGVLLYGHSGGGAVALLVAARRADVRRVVTVAGLLDTEAWTRLDDMSPLSASLNPADAAARLEAIPQLHFVGAGDRVVPLAVAQSYAARFPAAHRPAVRLIEGQGHECCWAERWPDLLRQADDLR